MGVIVKLPKRSNAIVRNDCAGAPSQPDPWEVMAGARQDRGQIIARSVLSVLTTIPAALNRRLRAFGRAIAGELGKHIVISRRSRDV